MQVLRLVLVQKRTKTRTVENHMQRFQRPSGAEPIAHCIPRTAFAVANLSWALIGRLSGAEPGAHGDDFHALRRTQGSMEIQDDRAFLIQTSGTGL